MDVVGNIIERYFISLLVTNAENVSQGAIIPRRRRFNLSLRHPVPKNN